MKLRPITPFLALALVLQLGGPQLCLGAAPAHAASLPAECREPLEEEEDGIPPFLKSRAAQREKFRELESITTYPAEMLGRFDAQIKILADPEDALAAKLLLIRNANESVDIAHFILITDRTGQLVVAELKSAILRGVAVRVLVDSYGSRASIMGIVSDLKALLAAKRDAPGKKGSVEVVVFNPQMHLSGVLKKWFTKLTNLFKKAGENRPVPQNNWNNRLHDKIVAADLHMADRAVAIVGGRGIEEIYYAFPDYGPKTFRDLEMVVRNPRAPPGPHIGDVLGTYFDSLYYHLGNKFLSLGFRSFLGHAARRRLQAIETEAATHLGAETPLALRLERLSRERYLEEGFEPASLQFVHEAENALRKGVWRDNLEHDRFSAGNPGSLTLSLRDRLKQAGETVDIVTPYAWFPPEEVKAMQEWVDTNPARKIRIITNSIATGDSPLAQSLVDAEVGPAFMTSPSWMNSRGQIQVLSYGRLDDVRYGGPTWYGRLHAKYFIFDRKFALVTSYNADPRSRYWSTESGFYVHGSPTIVEQLVADADNLAAMSTTWGSADWAAVRSHPANQRKLSIQNLLGRIMRVFGLTPLV